MLAVLTWLHNFQFGAWCCSKVRGVARVIQLFSPIEQGTSGACLRALCPTCPWKAHRYCHTYSMGCLTVGKAWQLLMQKFKNEKIVTTVTLLSAAGISFSPPAPLRRAAKNFPPNLLKYQCLQQCRISAITNVQIHILCVVCDFTMVDCDASCHCRLAQCSMQRNNCKENGKKD